MIHKVVQNFTGTPFSPDLCSMKINCLLSYSFRCRQNVPFVCVENCLLYLNIGKQFFVFSCNFKKDRQVFQTKNTMNSVQKYFIVFILTLFTEIDQMGENSIDYSISNMFVRGATSF